MVKWRHVLAFFCGAVFSVSVLAQARPGDYPNRPVKLIVPSTPGGSGDVLARLIASFAEKRWKQSLVVENRPGASGQIGAEATVKAAPDGYTLFQSPMNLAYEHLTNPAWPYQPFRDFSHVALLAGSGYALITSANLPVRNLSEFIAHVKANKGKLNRAVMGTPSTSTEELLFRTGIYDALENIMYKGGAPAVQAVATGEAHFWTAAPQDVIELAKQGRLRILAYTEKQRHPLMPDVPTVAESKIGLDDYEAAFWFGMFGPAGMPAPVIAFLNSELREFVKEPEAAQRLGALGLRTYSAPPEELRAQMNVLIKQVQDVKARQAKPR